MIHRPTLVIGQQANGTEMEPHDFSFAGRLRRRAFQWGPSRRRLDSLGLRLDHTLNLLPPGEWDAARAAEVALDAAEWARRTMPDGVVVPCGRLACDALGLAYEPLAEDERYWGSVGCLILPHPSGRCLWWNDVANRAAAREAIRRMGCHTYSQTSTGRTSA